MPAKNDPPIRVGTLAPELAQLYPEDRRSCDHCRRTSGLNPFDELKCPRLPKYPGDILHRCWYFLPKAHLEDQRPGPELYATDDPQQRAWFGEIQRKAKPHVQG